MLYTKATDQLIKVPCAESIFISDRGTFFPLCYMRGLGSLQCDQSSIHFSL